MKQDEFNKLLAEFWESHPLSEGWTIETEAMQNGMKATIRKKGDIIVTAHEQGTNNSVDYWERDAIARAISYMPKQV